MKTEKKIKFMFTERNIISIDIIRRTIFFLFKKIPLKPIKKRIDATNKCLVWSKINIKIYKNIINKKIDFKLKIIRKSNKISLINIEKILCK